MAQLDIKNEITWNETVKLISLHVNIVIWLANQ